MAVCQILFESLREKIGKPEFWIHCLLFSFLMVAYWPLTTWFAGTIYEQSRTFHALIVLGLASVALVRFGEVRIEKPFELGLGAKRALYSSYGLLLINYLAPLLTSHPLAGLLVIPTYCAGMAACVRFVFGEGTRRLTRTTASTFCVFLLISFWMEPLDWPLRQMAGEWSAYILDLLGQTVELRFVGDPRAAPMLILLVNEHSFHVAAECNGFGVILTGLLISVLLAVYRRLNGWDIGLNVLAGLLTGFAFNIIRIVIIVLLTPFLMNHYNLMHEIVGSITYWGCLILLWVFLNGPVKPESANQ